MLILPIRPYLFWAAESLKVVELILKEMQNRPDMWFEALRRLTNKNPAESAMTFADATKAWLDWGREQRIIS